jgi:hypothetical protein
MTSSAWKGLSAEERLSKQQLLCIVSYGEKTVSTVVSPVPSLNIYQDDAGNIAGSFAVPASVPTGASTVNWAALLQWLATYGPSIATAIAALIAAFGSPTPPPPAHIETRS